MNIGKYFAFQSNNVTEKGKGGTSSNYASHAETRTLTLQQAVERLGVSELSIRRLIEQKVLPATQAVPCAPWEIPLDTLNLPAVQRAIDNARRRKRPPTASDERTDSLFSES